MRNCGKLSRNTSGLGIQTLMELRDALLAAAQAFGRASIVGTELVDSTKRLSLMKETIMRSAKSATASKEASKPSTKKKSKKGTAKEHGTRSSSKAVKSVKGVKWK